MWFFFTTAKEKRKIKKIFCHYLLFFTPILLHLLVFSDYYQPICQFFFFLFSTPYLGLFWFFFSYISTTDIAYIRDMFFFSTIWLAFQFLYFWFFFLLFLLETILLGFFSFFFLLKSKGLQFCWLHCFCYWGRKREVKQESICTVRSAIEDVKW